MSIENNDQQPPIEPPTEPQAALPTEPQAELPTEPYPQQPTQPQQPYLQQPPYQQQQPYPQQPPRQRMSRRTIATIAIAAAAGVVIGGAGTAGVGLLIGQSSSETSAQSHARSPLGLYSQDGGQSFQNGLGGGFSEQGSQYGDGSQSSEQQATASTAAQKVGVVTINTELDYTSSEQAAGTGMILSSNGTILTNNHVVEGATSISVTVESTGQTYKAQVVGTDKKADVAVLKLTGASGLTPVSFAASEKVVVGQAIHSVGNAEGTGDLVTAVGTVGAVNQSLTVQGDQADESESLTGLIQLDSDVVSGDSGGPLFDQDGHVIGIVTAASSNTADVTGYAINIASVLKVSDQIRNGQSSSDIVLGTPAFLGVEIATTTTAVVGVPVSGAFDGMPAAEAGIGEGDVITAVNGTAVTTATQLSALIAQQSVGDRVTIHWTDANGGTHSAPVTLSAGPAA
jgi:S1-C subfamily serine protease